MQQTFLFQRNSHMKLGKKLFFLLLFSGLSTKKLFKENFQWISFSKGIFNFLLEVVSCSFLFSSLLNNENVSLGLQQLLSIIPPPFPEMRASLPCNINDLVHKQTFLFLAFSSRRLRSFFYQRMKR